jgi:non-ribosomal peptide synthetase component F
MDPPIPSDDSQVPIGLPLTDTPLCIINPATLKLLESYEEGELITGGYGVSDGYINNNHETASKFLANGSSGDGKACSTGDRVQRYQDENLQFLARFDKSK